MSKENWKKPFYFSLLILASFIGNRSKGTLYDKIFPNKKVSASSNSASSSSASSDGPLVELYSCSPFDSDRALELKPKITTKKLNRDILDHGLKQKAFLRLKAKMEKWKKTNMDEFIENFEHYKSEASIIERETKELKLVHDKFTEQMNKYNNYLIEHCTYTNKAKIPETDD